MNKKAVFGWTMYDWANSAFATTVMAAVLPIFYLDVAAKGLSNAQATSYWGYSQTIALIIVVLLSPILGSIADYAQSKKAFLRFFTYMGAIASALLACVGEGGYFLASVLFIISTIGFSGGNVFYDAFLPEIAPEDKLDRISTRGYAYGYIGGGHLALYQLAHDYETDLVLARRHGNRDKSCLYYRRDMVDRFLHTAFSLCKRQWTQEAIKRWVSGKNRFSPN